MTTDSTPFKELVEGCQHGAGIQTYRFGDGTPAGLWSCVQCAVKFVPMTQLAEESERQPAGVGSSASLGLLPERANDSGSTPCLVRWIVETPAGWLGAWNVEAFDAAAGIVRDAEIERQRLRIEQLRGLCKTAVGWLRDAEADRSADELQALIGDMERPGSGCVECGGPLQWRCPACRIAQSAKVAENNAGRDDGEGHCVRCGIELDDAHECPPGFMPATSQPANVGSNDGLGVAVLVDGALVAWFAEMDEDVEDFCRAMWFGRWLTWRATPPEIVPLTPEEQARCAAWAKEVAAAIRVE